MIAEGAKVVHKALDLGGKRNLAWVLESVNERMVTHRPNGRIRGMKMDAFSALYIFPQENYFLGGLVLLIVGLLGWRWWYVSSKNKEPSDS